MYYINTIRGTTTNILSQSTPKIISVQSYQYPTHAVEDSTLTVLLSNILLHLSPSLALHLLVSKDRIQL